jgi:hypothetical protein
MTKHLIALAPFALGAAGIAELPPVAAYEASEVVPAVSEIGGGE